MEDAAPEPVTDPDAWAAPLWPTLRPLAIPGVIVAIVSVLGVQIPSWALYGVGGVFVIVILPRIWGDPEPLLAIAALYLPLNQMFVVPLAPGLNGTNALEALLIISAIRQGRGSRIPSRRWMRLGPQRPGWSPRTPWCPCSRW